MYIEFFSTQKIPECLPETLSDALFQIKSAINSVLLHPRASCTHLGSVFEQLPRDHSSSTVSETWEANRSICICFKAPRQFPEALGLRALHPDPGGALPSGSFHGGVESHIPWTEGKAGAVIAAGEEGRGLMVSVRCVLYFFLLSSFLSLRHK